MSSCTFLWWHSSLLFARHDELQTPRAEAAGTPAGCTRAQTAAFTTSVARHKSVRRRCVDGTEPRCSHEGLRELTPRGINQPLPRRRDARVIVHRLRPGAFAPVRTLPCRRKDREEEDGKAPRCGQRPRSSMTRAAAAGSSGGGEREGGGGWQPGKIAHSRVLSDARSRAQRAGKSRAFLVFYTSARAEGGNINWIPRMLFWAGHLGCEVAVNNKCQLKASRHCCGIRRQLAHHIPRMSRHRLLSVRHPAVTRRALVLHGVRGRSWRRSCP